MKTPHNNAPDGAFAKTVLMPGDPLRAKFIAETFLDNPQLVNTVRNMFAYTGTYKGIPVSVMASGMGIPSIGIYSEELFTNYGVENIIRIGSAGSYTDALDVMDVVLARSAYSNSTFALYRSNDNSHLQYPSEKINNVILAEAERLGICCKLAQVHSSDVFYGGHEVARWQNVKQRTSSDCVEMESFALFHVASQLGKNAACLLTISDSFVSERQLDAEQRQSSFLEMMKLALESAILL